MTTKKNLVKPMLMSILTAGIFSFAFAFTACSDDDIMISESTNPEMVQRPAARTLRTFLL